MSHGDFLGKHSINFNDSFTENHVNHDSDRVNIGLPELGTTKNRLVIIFSIQLPFGYGSIPMKTPLL